jgi:hypothetical protein
MKEHVKISWRTAMPNGNYLEFWDEGDAKAFDQMMAERYRAGAENMRERAAKMFDGYLPAAAIDIRALSVDAPTSAAHE